MAVVAKTKDDQFLVRYGKNIGIVVARDSEGTWKGFHLWLLESLMRNGFWLALDQPLPHDDEQAMCNAAFAMLQRAKVLWPPGRPETPRWFWREMRV